MSLNKQHFESWILSITNSTNRDRYLLYDLDSPLINQVINAYSKLNSADFLDEKYYLFNFQDGEDFYKPVYKKICPVGYSDLVTARTEGKHFIVLVPKLGNNVNVLPSDSSKDTALDLHKSTSHFANFILKYIIEERISSNHFKQMQELLEINYPNDIFHFFYKQIESNIDVFAFYGLLSHNPEHFNDVNEIKKCDYRIKFIDKIKDFLSTNSISELGKKLLDRNVTNVDKVIELFWEEPYDLAIDLGRNIDLVFFRNTEKYRLLINVDEWIAALEDKNQIADGTEITFEGKNKKDEFSVLFNSKIEKYIANNSPIYIPDFLINDELNIFLNPLQNVKWSVNSTYFAENTEVSLNPVAESFYSVRALKNEKSLGIEVVIYDENTCQINGNDFAFRLYNSSGDLIPLKQLKEDNTIELPYLEGLGEILKKNQFANYNSEDFKTNHLNIRQFKFSKKNNKLEHNSKCTIDFRFISEDSKLLFLGFKESDTSEMQFNYNEHKDFYENESLYEIFKTQSIEISEIANGQLIFKVGEPNNFQWVIIEIETEKNDVKDLLVSNSFLKLKASNDIENKKRKIRIEDKDQLPNSVHFFYFNYEEYSENSYMPIVFEDLKSFNIIDNGVNCFAIGSNMNQLQHIEFRPLKERFDQLIVNNLEFNQYQINRKEILEKLKKQMINSSFDHIQFSRLGKDFIDLITRQLEVYNKLLQSEPAISTFIDTFYICTSSSGLISDEPIAMFFSPLNPFFLFQLVNKSIIMDNTINGERSKLNSICQTIQLNVLKHWIIVSEKTEKEIILTKLETDSLLFTGYWNHSSISEQNNLTQMLSDIKVNCNENFGFLSYRQIQSALTKSFDYLSQKPEFNICIKGELNDQYSNLAILNWIEKTNSKLQNEYENYRFIVNIYDQRSALINPYPADNEISYFRNDLGLDINWFKSSIENYDITILTTQFSVKSELTQKNENLLSYNYTYNTLVGQELNKSDYHSFFSDIVYQNSIETDSFNITLNLINYTFTQILKSRKKQIQHNLQNAVFENSELLAISSQISSSRILRQLNRGKSLWEYSIADYSYQDTGRGDYYLLAEENTDYLERFNRLIKEINSELDDESINNFLDYSKSITLFQLKNLLSNSNFIKEFIGCVTARKLIDCAIINSNTIVVPYDLFQPRLHKIKSELNQHYQIGGTQFPDFIIFEFNNNENGHKTIDFRLVEIKYRKHEMQEDELNQILLDQTSRIKDIFNELNSYRYTYSKLNMWSHTLSLLLSEMFAYYHDNFGTLNSNSAVIFNDVINSEFNFQLNESLIIAIDGSNEFKSGKVDEGIYFKVPASEIHKVFDCSSDINSEFNKMFSSADRSQTGIDILKNTDISIEKLGLIHEINKQSNNALNNLIDFEEVEITNLKLENIDNLRLAKSVVQEWTEKIIDNDTGEMISIDRKNILFKKNELITVENIQTIESYNIKKIYVHKNPELQVNLISPTLDSSTEIEIYSENKTTDIPITLHANPIDYKDSENQKNQINLSNSELSFMVNKQVVFGKDGKNRLAIFYPSGRPGTPSLPNYNIMVTGSSGKGKTQFIKSFVYQQSLAGTSFTIIDFRNDYSDEHFRELCNAKKIEVKFEGIPYNPLIPRLSTNHNKSKYYDVSEHISAICSVLADTFKLGIQQEADLKNAVRKVYSNKGINPKGVLEYDATLIFPSFNDVGDFLQSQDKDLEKLYNRLDPLFDLALFKDKYKNVGFSELINESNIIKVSDIQDDKIKNAIAKMIIVSAHGYYLGIPHSYNLNKYFVFDEAHRILDSDFVEKFIRECRPFGVGLLLSSQQPDDFPENVLGQLATKVIHGNEADARLIRKIKSLISFNGDDRILQSLQTFDAIVNSQDYDNWKVKTLAWPQLILLQIISNSTDGITLEEIISKSIHLGISKDWEEYIQMLIQQDYIKVVVNKYFVKD